ncbi:hypothetical protein YK48G_17280 [Lentilactobacillus fungorum]|uniref:Helix-turn-helix domain-containing protein n=1 Tax=Lentilactobacillus fungorum TaxID=2201250 RepID=A0ABQ3W0Y1_9LACO|nr:helix-turn-helix domain-containing protein [Lentilactobacillus fungorum]GHP14303.1 hypothetical protein YK48G_17280 [Lentilactobacillus fungorum]
MDKQITGYGYVVASMMRSALPRKAKLLYCFLTVFADSTTWEAHPKVNFICYSLGMTAQTFRKYRDALHDFVIVSKSKDGRNSYFLKVNEANVSNKEIQTKGYGYLPKAIMLDPELDGNSKLIYAFLAAYAGQSGITYPSVGLVASSLGMNHNTYYKYQRPLVKRGLIKITRRFDGRKNQNNIYTLIPNTKLFADNEQPYQGMNEGRRYLDYDEMTQSPLVYFETLYGHDPTQQQKDQMNEFGHYHNQVWVNYALYEAKRRNRPYAYAYKLMKQWHNLSLVDINDVMDFQDEWYADKGKENIENDRPLNTDYWDELPF